MNKPDYDVVILGGGLAGGTFVLIMKQSDLRENDCTALG